MSTIRMLGAVLTGCLLLPAAACTDAADDADAPRAGGKADGLGAPTQVTIAPAGTFTDLGVRKPAFLHYGFTDQTKPGWSETASIAIQYDAQHQSLPITIDLTDADAAYLGFVIESTRQFSNSSWSDDLFLEVASPAGSLVALPLSNGAGYPFSPECYSIGVQNEGASGPWSRFDGVITDVMYGYTPASLADYQADNDVAWFDLAGNEHLAGDLVVRREHDGGYKGAYFLHTEYVWVPEGMNLAFKLNLDKYAGYCPWGDDTRLVEHTATQTFFRQVAE